MGLKVYRALITQEGEDAPTVHIVTNTFGAEPQWSRLGDGTYPLTLEGAFDGSVFFNIPGSEEGYENSHILIREIHDDYILLVTEAADGTGRGVDGILGQVTGRGTPIEIYVYTLELAGPSAA